MSDEVEDFLEHYGVKGMRWGKRQKSDAPQAENYTDRMRKSDKQHFGKGGVKRINKNMVEGTSRSKALNAESVRRGNVMVAKMALTYGALMYGPGMVDMGGRVLNSAVLAKQESNGRKFAEKMAKETAERMARRVDPNVIRVY